jgi:hypothetical protein
MAIKLLGLSYKGCDLIMATGVVVLCGLLAGPLAPYRAAAQVKKDTKKTESPGTTDSTKPFDIAVGGGQEQISFINAQLAEKWKDNKIKPADRASDYEFIRRASLDIIGRIAKPGEIAKFMSWPPQERRSKLIEHLLTSPEFSPLYAENFANIFANLLMTRSGSKLHHEQMQVWLTDEFENKYSDWSKTATSLLSATGTTNGPKDEPAVNFILAHLGEQLPGNPEINGKFEMVPVTSRITRLFLGLRTQCTQCHDHKFNDWKQENFWGINGYLRQVDAPDGRPTIAPKKKGMAKDQQYRLVDVASYNKKAVVPYERPGGLIEATKPIFLDGTKFPEKLEGTRRQELAKLITKSPYFAKAFVNRMWGHFFGRGFTKDVDDFDDLIPISHPKLLDKLATDWSTTFKHNPRDLIRWICNSKAYGLSSVANDTNHTSDADQFFSRMLLKAMTPEQMFESLMTATDFKDSKAGDAKRKMREDWLQKLVVNFGDDEGNEGTFNGTVVQALLMMNGQELNTAIMDKDTGTVARVMKSWTAHRQKGAGVVPAFKAAISELYRASLNREPSDKKIKHFRDGKEVVEESEWQRLLDPNRFTLKNPFDIQKGVSAADGMKMISDRAFVEAYCQDLMWALLNSNEFILNH